MFVELDVWVYSSLDLFSTTEFNFNSLRASFLTVLRFVYAIVRVSSGKDVWVFLFRELLTSSLYIIPNRTEEFSTVY